MPVQGSIDRFFKMTKHYREKHLQSIRQQGGASEPILSGEQLGEVLSLWRNDFEENDLLPFQQELRGDKDFKAKLRGWFMVHLRNIYGSQNIVKVLLQRGTGGGGGARRRGEGA